MLRNSLRSFAIHALVLAASGFLYSGCRGPISYAIVLLLALAGYAALAFVYLKPLRSATLNLLSVIPVSLVGGLMGAWLWYHPGRMGFHWLYFMAYNLQGIAITEIFRFEYDPERIYWTFIFPFPFLWLGLQAKARRQMRQASASVHK
ncbi:hypothetical protein [Cohnella sp. 56]|uniref:hypothetical protein n=1 Tax=Cohnella sp. 56 TaxID=3113722 RepID=UPI0030E9E78A